MMAVLPVASGVVRLGEPRNVHPGFVVFDAANQVSQFSPRTGRSKQGT